MRFVFILTLSLGLAPTFAQAITVKCADKAHTVEIEAKVNAKRSEVHDIRIKSGGKTRAAKPSDVVKMRSNDTDFYLAFFVQTKNGREQVELDTHYSGKNRRASTGYLTNKTENSERLSVSCEFIFRL